VYTGYSFNLVWSLFVSKNSILYTRFNCNFMPGCCQGGDGVVECVHQESGRSNSVSAFKSWNVPGRKQNRRVEDSTGVDLERAAFIDGTIHCKMVVDSVLKIEENTYDLDRNDYFVLLAAGSSLKSTYYILCYVI